MIPVVMSGGSGTRLWPVSRAAVPKQFCHIFDEPLQVKTTRRLQKLGSPWVVTVSDLHALTEKTMQELQVEAGQVLYEPMARNTAAAIALLCVQFQRSGFGEEVVGIFPADHLISKEEQFYKIIELAQKCADQGRIVTIGIQPSYPATGFGYIQMTGDVFQKENGFQAVVVERFCEKPSLEKAQEFLASGQYVWNAGMFVFKVKTMIAKLTEHVPELWEKMQRINADLSNIREVYENLPAISIDYAIMEKLDDLLCIPGDIGWSDVGSWEEVAGIKESVNNQVFSAQAKNNFVVSLDKKVYGMVGVNNLIIVDTPDALLVAENGRSQEVKEIVRQLSEKKISQANQHGYEFRPWGEFEVISDRDDFKAKVITVAAGQRISYQSHSKRSEHWIVLSGQGEVTIDDQVRTVKKGDYIHIPLQAKHRIAADQKSDLKFFEVQTGSYFGEDDIVRYQDDYKRD